ALRRHDDDTVRGVLAVQGRRRGTLYDFDPLDRVRVDVVQWRWRGIVVFVAADEPLACMTCQVAAALTRLVGVHADAVDYDDRIVAEQCAAVATQPDTRGVTRRAGTPLHNEARYPALEKVGHARDRFRGHDRVRIDHCDVVAELDPATNTGCGHDQLGERRRRNLERDHHRRGLALGDLDLGRCGLVAERRNGDVMRTGRELRKAKDTVLVRDLLQRGALHDDARPGDRPRHRVLLLGAENPAEQRTRHARRGRRRGATDEYRLGRTPEQNIYHGVEQDLRQCRCDRDVLRAQSN